MGIDVSFAVERASAAGWHPPEELRSSFREFRPTHPASECIETECWSLGSPFASLFHARRCSRSVFPFVPIRGVPKYTLRPGIPIDLHPASAKLVRPNLEDPEYDHLAGWLTLSDLNVPAWHGLQLVFSAIVPSAQAAAFGDGTLPRQGEVLDSIEPFVRPFHVGEPHSAVPSEDALPPGDGEFALVTWMEPILDVAPPRLVSELLLLAHQPYADDIRLVVTIG